MAKKQRKSAEAELTGSVVLALLAVVFGGLLSMFNLVRTEVEEVTALPAEEERPRHTFYYQRGGERGPSQWEMVRAAVLAGETGTYALTEVDLNQWARRQLRYTPPTNEEDGSPGRFPAEPEQVNFRFVEDRLQIGMQVQSPMPFFRDEKIFFVSEGRFEKRSSGWVFAPERVNLGKSPIPGGALFREFAFDWVLSALPYLEEADELGGHWDRIRELRIEENQLVMVLE